MKGTFYQKHSCLSKSDDLFSLTFVFTVFINLRMIRLNKKTHLRINHTKIKLFLSQLLFLIKQILLPRHQKQFLFDSNPNQSVRKDVLALLSRLFQLRLVTLTDTKKAQATESRSHNHLSQLTILCNSSAFLELTNDYGVINWLLRSIFLS